MISRDSVRMDESFDDGCEEGGSAAVQGANGDLSNDVVNNVSRLASNREQRRAEAEEDRVLVHAAQNGDKQAFRKLVEKYQRRVYSIALGVVRDENDALEVSQEAFFRVFRGLCAFQGECTFYTWLFRIVTNLSIDFVRRPGRRNVSLTEDGKRIGEQALALTPFLSHVDGEDPLRVVRRKEIAQRLQEALDALPPYHLAVILMREVEGMSYEEMASVAGVTVGTIMSRLFHARQKLQRALVDCYAEETGSEEMLGKCEECK